MSRSRGEPLMGMRFKQPCSDGSDAPSGMCSEVSVIPGMQSKQCNRVSFESHSVRHEDLHCVPGAGDPMLNRSSPSVADARPRPEGGAGARGELDLTTVAPNAYIPQAQARAGTLPLQSSPSAGSTAAGRAAAKAQIVEQRQAWVVGSVLEVFSATNQCWYVASVGQAAQTNGQDMLTVQFCRDGEPQMKHVFRTDALLDVLGSHTAGEIPAGFQTLPSQSRPGQLVYLDTVTNKKYSTVDLAWKLHFDRLSKSSPSGMPASASHPATPSYAQAQQSAVQCQPLQGHAQGSQHMKMTAYGPAPSTVACR